MSDGRATNGGARPGAGRPPRETPREALTIRVEPEAAEAFRALCAENQQSQAEIFTELVASRTGAEPNGAALVG